VRLSDRADDTVKTYSLGMRQRLGVARALLNDPKLLILDEPTNGLDPAGLAEFRDLIRSFVDEGRTVFISSHILGEVQKMADDIAIIQKGKMIAFGSVDEIISGGKQTIYVRTSDVAKGAGVLAALEGVSAATPDEHGGISLAVESAEDEMLARVGKALFENDLPVLSLYPVKQSLEQRFLDITDDGERGVE
jgi:ABC-2 type transport system ATP-binding protein